MADPEVPRALWASRRTTRRSSDPRGCADQGLRRAVRPLPRGESDPEIERLASNASEQEASVHHKTLEDLQQIAAVYPDQPPARDDAEPTSPTLGRTPRA
jgi:hypothetical protein